MHKLGSHKGNNKNAFVRFGQMGLRLVSERFGGQRVNYGEINIIVLDKDGEEFPKTIKATNKTDIGLAMAAHIDEVARETGSSSGDVRDDIMDALIAAL